MNNCSQRHFILMYLNVFLVFGIEPDLTREGGSIPVTLTFQEATGRNVMLLPVGSSDDGAHSQNEKINRYAILSFVSPFNSCSVFQKICVLYPTSSDQTTFRESRCWVHTSMRSHSWNELLSMSTVDQSLL